MDYLCQMVWNTYYASAYLKSLSDILEIRLVIGHLKAWRRVSEGLLQPLLQSVCNLGRHMEEIKE